MYYNDTEVILERGAHRITATLDHAPFDPEDQGAPFTVLVSQDRYDESWTVFNSEYGDVHYLRRVYNHFYDWVYAGHSVDTWDIVKRFYKVFHNQDVHISEHVGYSQGDHWTLVSIDSAEWRKVSGYDGPIGDAEFLDAVNWARGDVYILTHEYNHMKECHAGDDWAWCGEPGHNADNPEGSWREVESVGGFYVEFPNEEEHAEWFAGEFDMQGNPFVSRNLRKLAA